MLMRRGLVPLFLRYGIALLAAVLVFLVIHQPVNSAVLRVQHVLQAKAPQKGAYGPVSGPNDIPKVGEKLDAVAEANDIGQGRPVAMAAAEAEAAEIGEKQAPIQETAKRRKSYKKAAESYPPITDPFPWLTHNNKAPPVLENNLPPEPHVVEHTPLLIGFTRNWPMLLQCVCSYIAAGWPPRDIWIVENTGVFSANKDNGLSLQNPFFLNYTQLGILGVSVMRTPTLLNFAQLQNFYLDWAVQRGVPYFFWSHQDVLVFSDEEVRKKDRDHDHDHDPYATIYERAVGLMRYLQGPDMPPWATHFFDYDNLALVNRDAYLQVGAWDTHIPFHASDCDMYLRLHWAGFWQPQSEAGLIFDVDMALDDVGALFRLPGSHASFAGDMDTMDEVEQRKEREMKGWVDKEGETWQHLVQVAGRMQDVKWAGDGTWKKYASRQRGGRHEPFYRDPDGFEAGLGIHVDAGHRVFADKWGHRGCDLVESGVVGADAWRLERDWDVASSGLGSEGGKWDQDWMGLG